MPWYWRQQLLPIFFIYLTDIMIDYRVLHTTGISIHHYIRQLIAKETQLCHKLNSKSHPAGHKDDKRTHCSEVETFTADLLWQFRCLCLGIHAFRIGSRYLLERSRYYTIYSIYKGAKRDSGSAVQISGRGGNPWLSGHIWAPNLLSGANLSHKPGPKFRGEAGNLPSRAGRPYFQVEFMPWTYFSGRIWAPNLDLTSGAEQGVAKK